MEKSIIFTWEQDNIEKAPETFGVFLLRTTPINGDIVFINESNNLKEELNKIFKENTYPEVKFFDWYKTDSLDEAINLKKELVSRYHLDES